MMAALLLVTLVALVVEELEKKVSIHPFPLRIQARVVLEHQ